MMEDMNDRKINMTYLFCLVSTLTMGTTHVGFVVAGNNEVGQIYAA